MISARPAEGSVSSLASALTAPIAPIASGEAVEGRFRRRHGRLATQIDRAFLALMTFQWAAALLTAAWLSPRTWAGDSSSVHVHLWAALGLGGLFTLGSWAAVRVRPGTGFSRAVIGVSQMGFGGLLIHLTGGRIETHFHVFVSLSFLAAYRDWRALILPTALTAADHYLRGRFYPESIFGVATAAPWGWAEHAAWVLFADAVLFVSCVRGEAEMRRIERMGAELELRLKDRQEALDQVQKLSLVARATRHSVIVADARGRTEWVNESFTKLTGYAPEEILGRKPGETLQGPDTCPATKARIGAALRRGEAVSEELVNYSRSGVAYPIRLEIEPVRAPANAPNAGEVVNFVAIQTDLSEQRRQEEILREAARAAEAANEAKSAFLAHMSHEIRTPLNGILGFVDVLRTGGPDGGVMTGPDAVEHLDVVRASGDHLLALINDILDLSKVEAGRMEVEAVPCDPHEIIRGVMSALRVPAAAKGLDLECRWVGEAPETVVTDAGRLRQILTNLVGNAVKFTEDGSVRLRAAIENRDDPAGARLVVEVHDTGEGIPADKLAAVFEPFAQADSSVTRRHGGTGLGLSISRRLAERLGGSLTAESEPGWGSVFRLSVAAGDLTDVAFRPAPRGEAVAAPATGSFMDSNPDPREPATQPAVGAPDLCGLRVLVVDDGAVNRKLLRVVLARAGAEVVEAADGRAGVDAVEAAAEAGESLFAVLMDMQMPVLDGYAAAAELRAAGRTLPVIALTAHAMDGDREKCLAAGCSDFLPKPVRPAELLAKLAALRDAAAADDRNDETKENSSEPDAGTGGGPLRCDLPPDDDDLRELAAEFAAGLPDRLATCKRAAGVGDFAILADQAHRWGGTGGTLGYDAFTEPARELERVARAKLAGGGPPSDGGVASPEDRVEALLSELESLTARTAAGMI